MTKRFVALSERYTVETFQPVSSISGGRIYGADNPFGINSAPEVFAVLKRIRK